MNYLFYFRLTLLLLYKLIQRQKYSPEAIRLEHDFARCIHLQEAHGFHFDVASAKKLYASLANRRLELEKSLVSTFPNWKQYVGTFIPKRDNKTKGYKKGVPVKKYKEQPIPSRNINPQLLPIIVLSKTTPDDFIERYCSRLNMNQELTRLCHFISIKKFCNSLFQA